MKSVLKLVSSLILAIQVRYFTYSTKIPVGI